MIKISVAIVSLFSTLFLSDISLAECSNNGIAKCTDVTIDEFYPYSAQIAIDTSGDERLLGCRADGDRYIRLRKENPYYDIISALLLTAHETQHPVTVTVVAQRQQNNICDIYGVSSKK